MPEDSVPSNNRMQDVGYTMCIYAAFITFGWVQDLSANFLIDFMVMTNTENWEDGAWFSRSFLIGFGLGALTGGILYDKFNRDRVFGPCLLVIACTMAVAPWCSLYWAVISIHVIQGIAVMVAIIGGIAEILSIWRDNRISFLVLYLLHRFGHFIGRLFMRHYNDIYPGVTSSNSEYSGLSSRLFIPYLITALFIAVIVGLLFTLGCVYKKSVVNATNYVRSQNQPRNLPLTVKLIAVAIMSACFTLCISGNETYAYLHYYYFLNQEYIHYRSFYTDKLQYAEYGMVLASTMVTMFLTCCNTMVIAGSHCFLIFLSLSAFLISFLFESVVGVSISIVVSGCFKALLFSLLFVWTNEYITPVTGKISSFIVIMSMIGEVLKAVLMLYLIDMDTMGLCYLILIEGFLLILLFTIAFIMTRHIERRYGKTYSNTVRTYDDEVVTERLVISEL